MTLGSMLRARQLTLQTITKFADALEKAQSKIEGAGEELNKLVGTRTKMMLKKLENVTELTDTESEKILGKLENSDENL